MTAHEMMMAAHEMVPAGRCSPREQPDGGVFFTIRSEKGVPRFVTAHPGSTLEELEQMIRLALR